MMKLELRRGPDQPTLEALPEKSSLRRELFWMMVSVLIGLLIFCYFVVLPNDIDWYSASHIGFSLAAHFAVEEPPDRATIHVTEPG